MKNYFLLLILFVQTKAFSQSPQTIDSLTNEICASITEKKSLDDSTRIASSMYGHLEKYIENVPENKREEFFNSVFVRLQVKCEAFITILHRNMPKNENWLAVDKMPDSKLTKDECLAFFKIQNYKYVETNGDTTALAIKNGYWNDTMKDGTYSKLKLKKTSDSDFEITFISSNNEIKKKLSRPGEKYYYRLIEKEEGYYVVCVGLPAVNKYYLFNIHF